MEPVVELQRSLRSELKEPLGPVFTDTEELLGALEGSVVAVGDVVTRHLIEAGRVPDVALIDGRTERTPVGEKLRVPVGTFDRERSVTNPPGTLTVGLLEALSEAIDSAERTVLVVEGEEDLAALPAVLATPPGTSVVYGQPGEGMVLVTVDAETTRRARELLGRMEGDTERLLGALGIAE